jgi:hypothetical protein
MTSTNESSWFPWLINNLKIVFIETLLRGSENRCDFNGDLVIPRMSPHLVLRFQISDKGSNIRRVVFVANAPGYIYTRSLFWIEPPLLANNKIIHTSECPGNIPYSGSISNANSGVRKCFLTTGEKIRKMCVEHWENSSFSVMSKQFCCKEFLRLGSLVVTWWWSGEALIGYWPAVDLSNISQILWLFYTFDIAVYNKMS